MKRSIVIGVILLLFVQGFSRMGEGMRRPEGPDRMGEGIHHPEGPDRMGGMMVDHGDMGFLIRFFGMESLMEKYRIQMERVYLDAKEQKWSSLKKRRQVYRRIETLLRKNIEDETVQKNYRDAIQSLYDIQKQISAINNDSMEKIKEIHEKQEKEMYAQLEEKMKRFKSDPAELKAFFEEMKSYRR